VSRHVPIRMCIGCGERAPQVDLLRLRHADDGTLVVVTAPPVSGRTGYLHRRPACWEQFARRKGRVRSLGSQVDRAQRMACVADLQRTSSSAIRL
jgi:predicted RNA-binding protein YlxR (DUF448 family)